MPALIVIAKAPAAGRVKTRLCPPCTPEQAAQLAAAALADTLDAARASAADRVVLALDGEPPAWLAGIEIVAQRGAGLAERVAAAFEDVGGPALLIGMDTPQVTRELLDHGLARLRAGAPAALGRAYDGGYWAIGLQQPRREAFAGVPMSSTATAAAQERRLEQLGLSPAQLPLLRDVDTFPDALAVAAAAPNGRFARAVAEFTTFKAAA